MKVLKFCCQFSFFQKLDFNHVEENNKIKDTVTNNKKQWKQQTTGSHNVHWLLSHQRAVGWGFTVKQGTNTIFEGSATYTVSTSSLTMEVEAVRHDGLPKEVTVRPHKPPSSQIQGACYKKSNVEWEVSHSSGTVWESRWPSWAVHPNEPYGFCGRKAILNHAHALVSACP